MNTNEAIDSLGMRLEDANKVDFTETLRLRALNDAQIKLANMLHTNYLTELQSLKTGVTVTAGVTGTLNNSLLTYNVLRGEQGIIKCRISSGGLWLHKLDIKDVKRTENSYLQGTTKNPLFYVFGNKIYVLPTTITSIDVLFLREPTTLLYPFNADQADSGASTTKFDGRSADSLSAVNDYYNGAVIYSKEHDSYHVITDYVGADLEFTVSPAATGNFTENQEFYFLTHGFDLLGLSGVDFDLNPALHEIIVTLAEAQCWAIDEKLERRNAAMKAAMDEIAVLNARFERAEGIGPKKEK